MATLRIHVVPNAKINKVVGEHGGAIKIKLRAPAVEGKANAALISFLAGIERTYPRERLFCCAVTNHATNWFASTDSAKKNYDVDCYDCASSCAVTRKINCSIARTRSVAIAAKNGQNVCSVMTL